MVDRAWDQFASHTERQVTMLKKIHESLANAMLKTTTLERRALMRTALEHYGQELEYFLNLESEIKKRTMAT